MRVVYTPVVQIDDLSPEDFKQPVTNAYGDDGVLGARSEAGPEKLVATLEQKLMEAHPAGDGFFKEFEFAALCTAKAWISELEHQVQSQEMRYFKPALRQEELPSLVLSAVLLTLCTSKMAVATPETREATTSRRPIIDTIHRISPLHLWRQWKARRAAALAEKGLNEMLAMVESAHPVLAAYDSPSETKALAILASGELEEMTTVLESSFAAKREVMVEMRRILEQSPEVIWCIEPILDATCERLGYSPESPEVKALQRYRDQRPVDLRMEAVGREFVRLGQELAQSFVMRKRRAA